MARVIEEYCLNDLELLGVAAGELSKESKAEKASRTMEARS